MKRLMCFFSIIVVFMACANVVEADYPPVSVTTGVNSSVVQINSSLLLTSSSSQAISSAKGPSLGASSASLFYLGDSVFDFHDQFSLNALVWEVFFKGSSGLQKTQEGLVLIAANGDKNTDFGEAILDKKVAKKEAYRARFQVLESPKNKNTQMGFLGFPFHYIGLNISDSGQVAATIYINGLGEVYSKLGICKDEQCITMDEIGQKSWGVKPIEETQLFAMGFDGKTVYFQLNDEAAHTIALPDSLQQEVGENSWKTFHARSRVVSQLEKEAAKVRIDHFRQGPVKTMFYIK